ncbi:LysR family transcriptional regulator [Luteimonas sp. TWI406]|uniref:LysR family transcriptional regulator n=1 Tax=Luteimonas sp. TWI406 TaxID=3136777 RepID=UPI003208CEC6
MPSGLDMDLLLTLDALLVEQNITHAAQRLGISQPAMSARLGRLRQVFDDRLFVAAPSGRGVVPTPRALALRPMLDDVLSGLAELVAPATFDPRTSQRTFVVALHENPALMLGSDLINRLRAQAPQVRIRFALPDMQVLPGQMERGEVDVFVGLSDVAEHGWVGRRLFSDTFLTAQRKGHPRGGRKPSLPAFCAAAHLVVSSAGDPFSGVVDTALAKLGRRRQVVMSTESYATAPALAATPTCCARCPGACCSASVPRWTCSHRRSRCPSSRSAPTGILAAARTLPVSGSASCCSRRRVRPRAAERPVSFS